MASNYKPIRYTINMTWNGGGENVVEIPSEGIANMIIDSDFDKLNMPKIYIHCNLSTKLLDEMIKKKHESTIILKVQKFKAENTEDFTPKALEDYIKGEFIYFLPEDINYNKDVHYGDKDDTEKVKKNPEDIYVRVLIGLMKQEAITWNRNTVNNIYRNCTLSSILLANTSSIPLILEPPNNTKISELIVPPTTTLSKLLKYLDSKHNIYKTPYRYFLGFDRGYIVSSSGNAIPVKDEKIEKILINIDNPQSLDSKIQGIQIDGTTHIMEISGDSTQYMIDNKTDNVFNNIITVDKDGIITEQSLNLQKTKGSAKKDIIVRGYESETTSMKQRIELSGVMIQIIKNDIDSSVFAINKEININNFKDHKEYNGKFLLSQKKEIFTKKHEVFVQNMSAILKKIT